MQVPGVRRRLRDVGKKVTGALAAPKEEPSPVSPVAPSPASPGAPPDAAPEVSVADAVPVPAVPIPAVEDPPVVIAVTDLPGDRPLLDPQCAAALDLARAAAVEEAGPAVGAHLIVEAEDERVATHLFETTQAGYTGWRWAVTVARAEGHDRVTVDEVVLLPGPDALLAPEWVPWSERVAPGDLTPGDLLPPAPDDARLVPGYADVDAEQLPFDLHRELGLGRARVLSAEGRADAAERWYAGHGGPDTPLAKAAPGRCAECGFLTLLAGALGRVFGVCANRIAPDDGRVVALTHGCGAHSETVVEATESSYAGMAIEDDDFEVVDPVEQVDVDLVDLDLVDLDDDGALVGLEEGPS